MEWIRLKDKSPPIGQRIFTKIDDENGVRNECELIFKKGLFWLSDGSMYVYYTPTHWHYI